MSLAQLIIFLSNEDVKALLSSRSSPIIHTFIPQYSRYLNIREESPSKISSQLQRDTVNSHFIKIYWQRGAERRGTIEAAFGRCTLREKKKKKEELVKCSYPEKRVARQNVIGPVALLQPRARALVIADPCFVEELIKRLSARSSSPRSISFRLVVRRDSFRSLRTTSNVLAIPLISFRELARATGIFHPRNKYIFRGRCTVARRDSDKLEDRAITFVRATSGRRGDTLFARIHLPVK